MNRCAVCQTSSALLVEVIVNSYESTKQVEYLCMKHLGVEIEAAGM